MNLKNWTSISGAAILVLTLMAAMAYGGMTALDEEELSEVKGQTGITMDISFEATSGYLALMDFDGFQTDTGDYADRACVTLGDFWANGGSVGTSVTGTGWKIDTGSSGSSTFIIIEVGELTSATDSGWGFNSFKIGKDPDEGLNIGSIAMTEIDMEGSTLRIEAIP